MTYEAHPISRAINTATAVGALGTTAGVALDNGLDTARKVVTETPGTFFGTHAEVVGHMYTSVPAGLQDVFGPMVPAKDAVVQVANHAPVEQLAALAEFGAIGLVAFGLLRIGFGLRAKQLAKRAAGN